MKKDFYLFKDKFNQTSDKGDEQGVSGLTTCT